MACLWAAMAFANHWKPNDSLESNMTVTAIVQVNGTEQRVEDLELGVFCNEECRGSQLPIYIAALDRYVYFTQVYGLRNDSFTFKLYSQSSGEELALASPEAISFNEDGYGSLSNPYILDFTEIVLENYIITVNVDPEEGGEVTGAGNYFEGQDCSVVATANEGFAFLNWTENGNVVSTSERYSFTVTSNRDLVSHFVSSDSPWLPNDDFELGMTLTAIVQINGVEQRSEDLELGVFCGDECRGTQMPTYIEALDRYVYFTQVYGSPSDVFTFKLYDHGQGREPKVFSTETLAFDADGYGSLASPQVLNFMGLIYQITVEANPAEGGVVAGSGIYELDDPVTLSATPNEGYTFVNWTESGEEVSTDPIYSFAASDTATFVANFSLNSYQVSAQVNPTEGGTVTGAGTYDHGATATLTAMAAEGYSFVNWTENGEEVSTDPTYSFTVTGDRVLTANFALPQDESVEIELSPGWNWISYLPATEMTVEAAFANLSPNDGDMVKSQSAFSTYNASTGQWSGGLNTFSPGRGLIYLRNGEMTSFSYPSSRQDLNTTHGNREVEMLTVYRGTATDYSNLSLSDFTRMTSSTTAPSGDNYYNVVVSTSITHGSDQYCYYSFESADGSLSWEFTPRCTGFWALVGPNGHCSNSLFTNITIGETVVDPNLSGVTVTYSNIGWVIEFPVDVHCVGRQSNASYTTVYWGNLAREQGEITAFISPENSGVVTGFGTYVSGETCSLTATANAGYTFVNWTENGEVVSLAPNYSFTVTGDRVLTANFVRSQHDSVVIELTPGWNWISYLPTTEMTVEAAFANLSPNDGDMVKSQAAFCTYNASTGQWSGGLKTFTPGRGLIYLRNGETTTFTYPK